MNISSFCRETFRQLHKSKTDAFIREKVPPVLKQEVKDFLAIQKNKPELRIFIKYPTLLRKVFPGISVNGEIKKARPDRLGHVFASVTDSNGKEHFFGLRHTKTVKGQISALTNYILNIFKIRRPGVISSSPGRFHVCNKISVTAETADKLILEGTQIQNKLNMNKGNKEYQFFLNNCASFAIDLAAKAGINIRPPGNKIYSPAGLAMHLREIAPKNLFLEV